tara:strand:+ start:44 stop:622 length:579 start_codon:yes stop_codon:yes gene_type:complete
MLRTKVVKLVIAILIILTFFFIYIKYFKEQKYLSSTKVLNNDEEVLYNSNIIKDINYSSEDLKGNKYILLAKEGEIDLNNTDIIFLREVIAYIKLKEKNETITITSDFGKYNTINFDTIFSKNVIINYIDNKITGEYLDLSINKNLLLVSRDVIYTNSENILTADVMEVEIDTKNTKIFMHEEKKKVNIKSK